MLQRMDDGSRIVAVLLASSLISILLSKFDLKYSFWVILLVYVAAVVFVLIAVERIRTEATWQGQEEERQFYRRHDLLKPRTDPAWAALRENAKINEADLALTQKLLRSLGYERR
jgi:hypothetical protein